MAAAAMLLVSLCGSSGGVGAGSGTSDGIVAMLLLGGEKLVLDRNGNPFVFG